MRKTLAAGLPVIATALLALGFSRSTMDQIIGEEVAFLVAPPNVPPPITRNHATKVVVNLETEEHVGLLADGVEYTFWTFGGQVPGNFIRIREGDEVEFHLNNRADSRMPHNIDLHAVTGPGGGAVSSFTPPGRSSVFSFKALNPGLYVYHCATAPVGMHIANGMYGMILVEPEEGLDPVDREYYVMQGEFYTQGAYGEAGLQGFSMAKAIEENPDYVVFNGAVGSLTGDNALQAEIGETVRLFVGNGGPNLISSFHVIGEIFDRVNVQAGTMVSENIQTTLIPAGGAAIAEFTVEVPGTFLLVDHSIFRTFNKGALGMLAVGGRLDSSLFAGRISDEIYIPEGGAIQEIAQEQAPAAALTTAERIEAGSRTYSQNCAACHQPTGLGLANAFPPLAGSDYLNDDQGRAIDALLNGLSEEITVNGESYNGVMPLLRLSDDDIANVLTYVYSAWGNSGAVVTPAEVRTRR